MKIRRSMIAVALACAVSSTAFAQENGTSTAAPGDGMRAPGGLFDATPHTRKSQLSLWAELGWWYGPGIAARYTLPLMADGFLAEINDSVELEFGPDLNFGAWGVSYMVIGVPVEGRWTFHILPNLALYAKVGIGIEIALFGGAAGVGISPRFDIAPGIIYNLTDSLVLRAESGYHGLRAGIGFDF